MAIINDLVNQIEDKTLRDRIEAEVEKLSKQKKFGLVFEDHLPECTPLYDIPVRKGSLVAVRDKDIKELYNVLWIEEGTAKCLKKGAQETYDIAVADLVSVAQFGEPIYPCLIPMGTVENAPNSDLWHTLIEADNYHALQLLEYLYAGKVDCIYIDPPYNTGARDWKYNNDYVDSSDAYRHSKWLSMLEKRLKIAKRLLNPLNSVLIVTIDEKEYLHLGCLLEEMFPEAAIQMITDVINPRGTNRENEFSRVEEYIFICRFGNASVTKTENNMLGNTDETAKARVWFGFNRGNNLRASGNGQFFPIYIDETAQKIVSVGEPMSKDTPISQFPKIEGLTAVFPINNRGNESIWRAVPETTREWIKKGYVKVSQFEKSTGRWTLSYIPSGLQKRIEAGEIVADKRNADGSLSIQHIDSSQERVSPRSVWNQKYHNATDYGATIIKDIIPNHVFSYPKSLYAVQDTLRFFLSNKPNALVIDFFAGSGTTLHAVNLINAEDNGKRRCIIVTNNEVSAEEAKSLAMQGYKPGDNEWEKLGIARYVTWPRTVCSIIGKDINGNPLNGEYFTTKQETVQKKRKVTQISFIDYPSLSLQDKKKLISMISYGLIPNKLIDENTAYIASDDVKHTVAILMDDTKAEEWFEELSDLEHIEEFVVFTSNKRLFNDVRNKLNEIFQPIEKQKPLTIPMANGFKANAVFFKLGFLDKGEVALGKQFKELLPILWMKAGAKGKCPELPNANVPPLMVLPENGFAVLADERKYLEFEDAVNGNADIKTVYVVTDSEPGFREIISGLQVEHAYQLYRDYLDNFRINTKR